MFILNWIISILGGYTQKEFNTLMNSRSIAESKGLKYDNLLQDYVELKNKYKKLLSELDDLKLPKTESLGSIHFPKSKFTTPFNISILPTVKTGLKAKVILGNQIGYIRLGDIEDKDRTGVCYMSKLTDKVIYLLKK